ncbi:MAG TPA: hypothetical protein VGF94_08020 [Kofleriaceae bacterium]|jgi:hypothetical protein
MSGIAKCDPKSFAHGTRARYVADKCRCEPCRAANTQYARDSAARAKQRAEESAIAERAAAPAPQVWTRPDGTQAMRIYKRACAGINGLPCPTSSHLRRDSTGDICGKCRVRRAYFGLVSSERARAHLLELAAAGVGKLAVRDACDVPASILHEVRLGRKPRIRVETERRILEVDVGAIADHACISARRTWQLLGELLALGIPKYKLARALGSKAERSMPALQLRAGFVLAKTQARVEKLHRELATQLLRETELREEFANAAELGAEFFARDSFTVFSRKSAAAAAPIASKPKKPKSVKPRWRVAFERRRRELAEAHA